MRAISLMRERANGLGGGFAAYGIYPDHPDEYALHVMYEDEEARQLTEEHLNQHLTLSESEPIPTRPVAQVPRGPLLWRYFGHLKPVEDGDGRSDDDRMVDLVMHVNTRMPGAFIASSGRNMGIFKGVGFPEDIGRFFRLDEYDGYAWIAHGRFPTNTTGWWGGAHPFGLLDWAVVHNGEVSSYGINRRYLQNFRYDCSLRTDTEVICYLFDLLMRKHGLPLEIACKVLAPPFWSQIERMAPQERKTARALRMVYGGALLNGPFSIVVGHSGGLIGLNDRTKLRPMVAARERDMLYLASEEAAIREVCESPDKVWHAEGGVPIVGTFKEEAVA